MYVWKASDIKTAFQRYMPELYAMTEHLDTLNPVDFHKALPKIYAAAQAISIDYAISEKADNLVLIPGDFGWNDVGDWKVVFALSQKDADGNVLQADSADAKLLTHAATQNYVNTTDKMVALLGVENLVVIDTPEILMIADQSRTQDVKKLVEKLKADGDTNYL
jgi:mannose-1-phosphate guanylyltransferase